ncbi:hypothetical protein HYU15_02460 [Candidatus Woesearchaeota archaeon]|nr:hypothetical protein [Candidatus Woesearchaeota archaeon]
MAVARGLFHRDEETKSIRKKAGKYEIDDGRHYILMELKDRILYVINAKRRR